MKKIFAAIVFTVLLLAALAAAASALPFRDVADGAWYENDVAYVYENKLMLGTSDVKFEPETRLTRAMYVTLIYRLHGESGKFGNSFSDIPAGEWYSDPVGWAERSGIVKGYEDGTFRPELSITRQELATMTARYLRFAWITLADDPSAPASFADGAKIADWAAEPFSEMRRVGLLKGDAARRANPEDPATRAETAAMVARLSRAVKALGTDPSIGGTPVAEIKYFCDFMRGGELDALGAALEKAAGVPAAGSDAEEANVKIAVDPSLPRLSFSLSEKDGVLTLSIPTEFCADRVAGIVSAETGNRRAFTVPEGYEGRGTFTLPEVTDAEGEIEFYGRTDRNPLSYEVGEPVTFRVSLLRNGRLVSAPYLRWEYKNDDGKIKGGSEPGHSGEIIVTFEGNKKPGAAMLTVRAANRKNHLISSLGDTRFQGSAIFGFGDIAALTPEPDDFDAFWAEQLAALGAVAPEVAEEFDPSPISRDGWVSRAVSVKSSGDPAYVNVTYPEGAEPGSLGIAMYFQGYGYGSVGAVYRGDAICVFVNPHSIENNREKAYYEAVRPSLEGFGFETTTREGSYFRDMLMRDVQALRFAESEFADLWNGVNVEVSGGSMGGFQSIAVAALCPEVDRLSAGIPWMADLSGESGGRIGGWLPGYNDGSAYYDSVYFASRVRCRADLNGGLGDDTCPPCGVAAIYNALRGEKTIVFTQNAYHGGYGGAHSASYLAAGDAVVPTDGEEIVDAGVAVPAPKYGDNRTLSDEEQKMKDAADAFRKSGVIRKSAAVSADLDPEEYRKTVYDGLVAHGLDPSVTVELDPDCWEEFLSDFREAPNGGSVTLILEYTVRSGEGYVDATARFIVSKKA